MKMRLWREVLKKELIMLAVKCTPSYIALLRSGQANQFSPDRFRRRYKAMNSEKTSVRFGLSDDLENKKDIASKIFFKKAEVEQLNLLTNWLKKPYIYEYWGDGGLAIPDFKKFTSKEVSIFSHFFGYYNDRVFSYFMTSLIDDAAPDIFKKYRASKGKTIGFDFMIGEEEFIGKKISHLVIQKFLEDQCAYASTVLTDPEARHKYSIRTFEKAGFEKLEYFQPSEGSWKGVSHILLRKQLTKLTCNADEASP